MQRFLVIGLGHFGAWVAQALHAQGHDVIAIDQDAELVDRHAGQLTRGVVGDATDPELLKRIGAEHVDAVILSTGENLATSILATLALRDLGIKDIYAKVGSMAAGRALDALQVRETVFPEREAAFRLAHRVVSKAVLEYIPLTEGYSIQEVAIPDAWLGKTLRELALPSRHGIQVVALHDLMSDEISVVPDAERRLRDSDVAIVAGRDDTIAELLRGRRDSR